MSGHTTGSGSWWQLPGLPAHRLQIHLPQPIAASRGGMGPSLRATPCKSFLLAMQEDIYHTPMNLSYPWQPKGAAYYLCGSSRPPTLDLRNPLSRWLCFLGHIHVGRTRWNQKYNVLRKCSRWPSAWCYYHCSHHTMLWEPSVNAHLLVRSGQILVK